MYFTTLLLIKISLKMLKIIEIGNIFFYKVKYIQVSKIY